MKRILITGANSYIGISVENWLRKWKNEYEVDTLDMQKEEWKEYNFSNYDSVFHVAGIAHADVGNVSEETQNMYYRVNRDLALETAEKAEKEGVAQFIYMSSIIIYGDSAPCGKQKIITEHTEPIPANFYGDSKWQADKELQKRSTEKFHVVCIRPPMIYGKGSKGNYPLLSKMACKFPVFPSIRNQRSMLHIDNLCEFVRLIIKNNDSGVFFPQNAEYVSTSDMVKVIAKVNERKIWITPLLNPFIHLISHIPGKISKLANKAFGNLVYEKSLSAYREDYRVCGMEESVKRSERE